MSRSLSIYSLCWQFVSNGVSGSKPPRLVRAPEKPKNKFMPQFQSMKCGRDDTFEKQDTSINPTCKKYDFGVRTSFKEEKEIDRWCVCI